jgi:hypothetical protein
LLKIRVPVEPTRQLNAQWDRHQQLQIDIQSACASCRLLNCF